jgi:predicted ATPase
MLSFDVPGIHAHTPNLVQTQICVIAGGPGSGKTSLLKAVGEGPSGFKVVPETAEEMIKAGIAVGISVEEQRKDPVAWQFDLLQKDFDLFNTLANEAKEVVLTDTSFVETVVFSARAGIEMSPAIDSWLRNKRYKVVFFLAPINTYEHTAHRMEKHDECVQISNEVQAAYTQYGYTVVVVPLMPIEDRRKFVEEHIRQLILTDQRIHHRPPNHEGTSETPTKKSRTPAEA